MKNKRSNNLFWKLFSVLCAVLLWFAVINIENPIETRIYKNIPIEYLNKEVIAKSNLVVTDRQYSDVYIKVRGKRLTLDKLRDMRGNIKANVDLKYYTRVGVGDPNPLEIKISLPNNLGDYVEVVKQEPKYTNITIQNKSKINKEIKYELTGKPALGYEVYDSEIKLDPPYITLYGAESNVDKLDKVKINVDINGSKSSKEILSEVKFYDKNNNIMEGIKSDINEVKINVPIYKAKVLTVTYDINNLNKDLKVKSVKITPKNIKILGEDHVVDAFNSIVNLPLDLSNIKSDKDQAVSIEKRLILPSNVINVDGINKIKFNINIERIINKNINFKSKDIQKKNQNPNYKYTLNSGEFIAQLKGENSIISRINLVGLKPYVDLKGLTEGEHEVLIKFIDIEGVDLINPIMKVKVNIQKS